MTSPSGGSNPGDHHTIATAAARLGYLVSALVLAAVVGSVLGSLRTVR